MIPVTERLALDDSEVTYRAALASGPGGQSVNKTSTAVELRFDVRNSPSLPDDVKARLERLAGARLTKDGVLILFGQVHRSQELNRQDVLDRLVALIRQAAERPRPRRPTKPTYGSKIRRMDAKARRSRIKAGRSGPRPDE